MQYNKPQNAPLVREALRKLGREDLIGYSHECLVRPDKSGGALKRETKKQNTSNKGNKKPNFQAAKKRKNNSPRYR